MLIFHLLHKDDLIEILHNAEKQGSLSSFLKIFKSQKMEGKKVEKIILSLRFELAKIIELLIYNVPLSKNLFVDSALTNNQKSTKLPSGIVEIKHKIENYYSTLHNCRVKVIGPYENEELEIARILNEIDKSDAVVDHYFLSGIVDAKSKLEIVRLSEHRSDLPEEYKKAYIVYDSEKYRGKKIVKEPGSGLLSFVNTALTDESWQRAISAVNSISTSSSFNFSFLPEKDPRLQYARSKALLYNESGISPILLVGGSSFDRQNFTKYTYENSNYKNSKFISIDFANYESKSATDTLEHALQSLFQQEAYEGPKKNTARDVEIPFTPQGNISYEKLKDLLRDVEFKKAIGQHKIDSDKTERRLLFIDNIDLIPHQFHDLFFNYLVGPRNNDLICIFGIDSRTKLSHFDREGRLRLLKAVVDLPTISFTDNSGATELIETLNSKLSEYFDIAQKAMQDKFKLSVKFLPESLKRIFSTKWQSNREMVDFLINTYTEIIVSAALNKQEISPTGELVASDSKIKEMLESLKTLDNSGDPDTEDIEANTIEYDNLYRVDLDAVKDLQKFLDHIERDYIISAFKKFGRNQTKVGQELGYTQAMISRKIRSLKIPYRSMDVN